MRPRCRNVTLYLILAASNVYTNNVWLINKPGFSFFSPTGFACLTWMRPSISDTSGPSRCCSCPAGSVWIAQLMASQQSQRWGYVQQPTDYKQQQQQLGRPDNNPSSSALERLASSNSSFTAVVSTVGNDMLPLSSSSSSSCSSSSSVSDTDASAMEAMKVDPLDLTCNSQSISRSSPTSGGATGHRNRNDSAPAVLDYEDQSSSVAQASGSISSGCNNRTLLFGLDDGERTDHQQQQRPNHRLMGTTAVVAGTGTQQASAVSVATPATTGVVAPPAPAAAITGGEEAHRCDMCGKTFAVPARLTRHYRTHTGEW